jgi:hypothetical protein
MNELLNCEILCSLNEFQVLAERWRIHYKTVKPHSSLAIPIGTVSN